MAAGDKTPGRRLPDGSPIFEDGVERQAGDYLRREDAVYIWIPRMDCYGAPSLFRVDDRWTVTENDDGTLTVDPSLLMYPIQNEGCDVKEWHGYLRNGVLEEV